MTGLNKVRFSVIITCFNDGLYIEEAISSVEKSSFKDYEIIIVDDCSTDSHTKSILDKLSKDYFIIRLQKNAGVGNARNKAIEKAVGEYILPLDADDKILPTYLEKAISILDKNKKISVVYTDLVRFGDDSSEIRKPDFSFGKLLAGNYVSSCSVFRKSSWLKCGGYDTAMPNYEDWEFWINIAEKGGEFFHLKEILFEYRSRKNSKVNRVNNPENRSNVVKYVCNKHLLSYQNHISEIVPLLHEVISNSEQSFIRQTEMINNNSLAEILVKYKFAEEELIRRTAYYENSIYIKAKRIVDKFLKR